MVNKFRIGDSFIYTINGHQFNVFVEPDGSYDVPMLCLTPLSSAFGDKVLEIPEQICNIPVKKIVSVRSVIYCTECIKFPKGIQISPSIGINCPIIEFSDLQDFYNNVNYIRNCNYYTQLKINGVIIDHLVMREDMILKTWQFKTLDFINIDDLSSIYIRSCQIGNIVNTDKITILPKDFDVYNKFNTPLRFPNLTIIESESISYGRAIITGDKLTFVEKDAVAISTQPSTHPPIVSYIITESNPIIYEQNSQRPIKIIKREKSILP